MSATAASIACGAGAWSSSRRIIPSSASWFDAGILTAEEARTHPRRNIITRALGTEGDNTPDLLAADLQPGDRFLLCTDGLTGMVRDDEIEKTLLDSQNADDAADRLIQMALDAGGSDNVTLILCTGEEGKPWKQD